MRIDVEESSLPCLGREDLFVSVVLDCLMRMRLSNYTAAEQKI